MEGDLMKVGNILLVTLCNFSSCKKTLVFAECEPSSKCKRLTAGGSLWRGDLRLSSGYVGGGPLSRLSSCQCCQHMDVTAESVFCGYKLVPPKKSIEAASFPAKVGSAMRFARRNCASCELEGRIYAIGGEQKFTTNWYKRYEVQDLLVYNMFIICICSMKYVLYVMKVGSPVQVFRMSRNWFLEVLEALMAHVSSIQSRRDVWNRTPFPHSNQEKNTCRSLH